MRVRRWTAEDADALRPLLLAFFAEHSEVGGDFLPTLNNADRFLHRGVLAADAGDPVLLAEDAGRVLGFCFWVGVPDAGFDLRARVCHGLGTYVIPPFRRKGVSLLLREAAKSLARQSGYDRIDGVALDAIGFDAGVAAGGEDAGIFVRLNLTKE